jgi:hypothetical protein
VERPHPVGTRLLPSRRLHPTAEIAETVCRARVLRQHGSPLAVTPNVHPREAELAAHVAFASTPFVDRLSVDNDYVAVSTQHDVFVHHAFVFE